MEERDPQRPRRRPAGRAPSPAIAARRRAVAVVAVALATIAIWAALFRDGGDAGEGVPEPIGVSPAVERLVEGMPVADRVDQLLLFGFEGSDVPATVVDELRAHQLGGVLIESRNWVDAEQGARLIASLRGAGLAGGRISPLIVTAQEGGRFRTLPDLPPAQRQFDIGASGSPRAAEGWALEAGAALRSRGFDLNLFPLADVATLDSPLADRAFSDDPALVASLTAAAIRGCREARIACAVAHFPGLGGASQDPATGPATVSLDAATLAARDLPAFRAAFDERAPATVLSLAYYAAYDAVTPAALAPSVADELLRAELGYEGLAITDDLGSGAVTANHTVPEAAVTAAQAGADLIQVADPSDQEGVREALLAAVESGDLPEHRLNEAAGRVLELKRKVGLLDAPGKGAG